MAEIPCPTCGATATVDDLVEEGRWVHLTCRGCGERIRYRVGSPPATARAVADVPIEYPPGTGPEGTEDASAYSTLVQPRSALGFVDEDDGEEESGEEPPCLLRLGSAAGPERIPITGPLTVFGRRADVELDDPAVSRHHFQIEAVEGAVHVRDLDSSNGTFVNGHRVRYTRLNDGDEVRAGSTRFVFRRP